jgi:glycosyltransferase involved in cell wall biosynthesis
MPVDSGDQELEGGPGRLLIATDDIGGGTGSHVAALVEKLHHLGWAIRVVCYGAGDQRLPTGVALVRGPGRNRWDRFPVAQLRRARHLEAQVKQWRPDVLHTYFFWSVMYGRYLKRRGAVRCLVENREDQGFNVSAMEYRLLRATAALPDRVVCVASAVKDVVLEREGLSGEQAVVIHNGLPFGPDRHLQAADQGLRHQLGLLPGQPVVGLVANLNREIKGVPFFIEAVPLILQQVSEARFLVLGDGHLRAGLESRVRELGVGDRVIFAGFQEDIHRFYPLMDVSTLTSLSEGLSITILESMSYGLPVVVTRVGGNPELVEDGKTGFLVPPRDPKAFAEAVAALLIDPDRREVMGAHAKASIQSFRIEEVAARYAGLYRSLVGGRGE